ncbi:unnamed protein product [Camellia sinensis]
MLVFVIFTGESWGYLGSRRFLLELDQHSDSVDGLNHTLIDTGLYYDGNNGVWYSYDHQTQQYVPYSDQSDNKTAGKQNMTSQSNQRKK